MMFIISLALLFILKLKFPTNKHITGTLRNRYVGQAMHNFRKVETLWRKKHKTVCDIEFLEICCNSNNAPIILRIKGYKCHLQRTSHVRELQCKLLENELSSKCRHVKKLQRTLTTVQTSISIIDFSAVKLWLNSELLKLVCKIKHTHEK